jgi:DNA-binding NarL/FixJ family response regulator
VTAPLRAVLAEDQALLRVGLTRILEASDIAVAAAVDNAPQLEALLAKDDFDIAIVDVRLPPTFSTEGLTAAIGARAARPGLPVLVLSQHVEVLYARELLAAGEGGLGYLLKDRVADVARFVEAVRIVAAGGTVLDPDVVADLLTRRGQEDGIARLTPREREVLGLMAEGRSNAAIARAMVITEAAVAKHISGLLIKLDLPPDAEDHRRVRAVLAYLRGRG